MGMFCYQCQETAGNKGCSVRGVCGKTEDVSNRMDLLLYVLKGISDIVVRDKIDVRDLEAVNGEMLTSLFMTITNANFDADAVERQIIRMLALRDGLRPCRGDYHDAATFTLSGTAQMMEKAAVVGTLSIEDEDIRSLRSLVIFGLKGLAAYAEHTRNLGSESGEIYAFLYEALAATLDDTLDAGALTALVLKTGNFGVKTMALLDAANTARYGNPEITRVNIGVRNNPAILISGHDLTDLEQLLEQTRKTGVDVYTHGEMLPAHAYPAFKKYENFVGNYGNAWWKQLTEFESFHGPILFTTNCIVPPKSEEIRARIFTTGAAGFPGCTHIKPDRNGKKDFSAIIALAKTLPAPEEIERGEIVNGFAHSQVLALADQVVDAVKSGAIRKILRHGGLRRAHEEPGILHRVCAKAAEGYGHPDRGLREIPL